MKSYKKENKSTHDRESSWEEFEMTRSKRATKTQETYSLGEVKIRLKYS